MPPKTTKTSPKKASPNEATGKNKKDLEKPKPATVFVLAADAISDIIGDDQHNEEVAEKLKEIFGKAVNKKPKRGKAVSKKPRTKKDPNAPISTDSKNRDKCSTGKKKKKEEGKIKSREEISKKDDSNPVPKSGIVKKMSTLNIKDITKTPFDNVELLHAASLCVLVDGSLSGFMLEDADFNQFDNEDDDDEFKQKYDCLKSNKINTVKKFKDFLIQPAMTFKKIYICYDFNGWRHPGYMCTKIKATNENGITYMDIFSSMLCFALDKRRTVDEFKLLGYYKGCPIFEIEIDNYST